MVPCWRGLLCLYEPPVTLRIQLERAGEAEGKSMLEKNVGTWPCR
jgi:hypothetical protein